jgi:hypothetical protein
MTFCVFVLVAGCGEPAATTTHRTARQPSQPVVPIHPKLDSFLGNWEAAGELECSIVREENGDVVIRPVATGIWESVVNNVRFDGDKLCFDRYLYYTGNETFDTATGDHELNGMLSQSELQIVPGSSNQLYCTVTSASAREPSRVLLTRAIE